LPSRRGAPRQSGGTSERAPREAWEDARARSCAEARAWLDSIDVTTPVGLRDRALIGLMVYSFARIGAALAMKVADVYVQKPPPLGSPAREGREAP
jgi:site-specific recombinase XerC